MRAQDCVACGADTEDGGDKNYLRCTATGQYGMDCFKCSTKSHISGPPSSVTARCPNCGNEGMTSSTRMVMNDKGWHPRDNYMS